MLQYIRGETATFYCSFSRVDGTPVDPVNPTVSVWQGATQIVADTPMIYSSVGSYYADWLIPALQSLGEYQALYKGVIDGLDVQGTESFEIVDAVVPVISGFYCSWDDVKACLLGLDVGDLPTTLRSRVEDYYIPNLKMEIDNYCRQNFDLTNVTQFFDGTGTEKIILPRRPIKEFKYCVLRVIPSISWYTFKRWRQINVIDSQGLTIAAQGGPEPIGNAEPPYNPSDYNWETTIEKADIFVDCSNGILIIPPRILYLEMQAIPFWNYTWLKGNNNIEVQYTYGYDANNYPRDLKLAAAKLAACQVLLVKGIGISAGANSMTLDGVSRNFGGTPYTALIEDFRKQAYAILDRFRRLDV